MRVLLAPRLSIVWKKKNHIFFFRTESGVYPLFELIWNIISPLYSIKSIWDWRISDIKYECSRDNGGGLNRLYVFLASIKRNRDGHFGIGWSDKYMHRCVCVCVGPLRARSGVIHSNGPWGEIRKKKVSNSHCRVTARSNIDGSFQAFCDFCVKEWFQMEKLSAARADRNIFIGHRLDVVVMSRARSFCSAGNLYHRHLPNGHYQRSANTKKKKTISLCAYLDAAAATESNRWIEHVSFSARWMTYLTSGFLARDHSLFLCVLRPTHAFSFSPLHFFCCLFFCFPATYTHTQK